MLSTSWSSFQRVGVTYFSPSSCSYSRPSLSRPANTLYRHNLTATLETAIRGSSSATDDPDTLRRLDARMLEFAHGEIGWDVFTLEYKVDPPVDVVLDERSTQIYTKLFKHLWRIKRVEYALNESWRRVMNGSRWFNKVKGECLPCSQASENPYLQRRLIVLPSDLQPDFHQSRIALSEMLHFVKQLSYFCHLEVIDCSWTVLEEFINRKEGDLDALIEAHRAYTDRLVCKALLRGTGSKQVSEDGRLPVATFERDQCGAPLSDRPGHSSRIRNHQQDDTILRQVREAFKVMLQFKDTLDALCNYALAEASRIDSQMDEARVSGKGGLGRSHYSEADFAISYALLILLFSPLAHSGHHLCSLLHATPTHATCRPRGARLDPASPRTVLSAVSRPRSPDRDWTGEPFRPRPPLPQLSDQLLTLLSRREAGQ